eukprot:Lithocolla_globosa_v1_NODE_1144_length_2839_cov_59.750449.p4 type:complete len:133 gc:universal NODE_1144_length_2839_cov_59.750449:2290-2688(+)
MSMFLKAVAPHLRNWNRSALRLNSISMFFSAASGVPNSSTWTEWSMTRSTGTRGLIFSGSPPNRFIASRIAAQSTTAGTPVKSCKTTRAGLKGISMLLGALVSQSKIFSTSASFTAKLSQDRTAASNKVRME